MSLSKQLRASAELNTQSLRQGRKKLPELKVSASLPNAIPSKNQFERLSGLYDYSVSAGVFAEPDVVTKPSSRCVRCSSHASLCMPCTELLCDESLTFYRKTRAKGAIRLFQNAVTEAGLGHLLKFVVFKLWRNGTKNRLQLHNKKKYIVEKLFGQNVTAIPFKAWQQFTRATRIQRRDHKIHELSSKLDTLSSTVSTLNEFKKELEIQLRDAAIERSKLNSTISSQEALITSLQKQLADERLRVLGLSSLAEPVGILLTLVEDMRNSTAVVIRNALLEERNNCFEFHPDAYQGIDSSEEVVDQDMAFSSDFNPASSANKYLMFKWLYDKGAEASHRVDTVSGQPIDNFLPIQPPDPPIKGQNYDLTDAKLLLRAVVSLMFDQYDDNNSMITRETGVAPAAVSVDVLKEINSVKKSSPLSMMRIAVRLAREVLQTPLFKANDLSRGDGSITLTFVGYLMLTAAPVRPQYTNANISKYLGEYEKMERQVIPIRNKCEGIVAKLFAVQSSYANATNQAVVTSIMPQASEDFKRSSKLLLTPSERVEESRKEAELSKKLESARASARGADPTLKQTDDGSSDTAGLPDGDIAPEVVEVTPPSPAELYSTLVQEIDDFLSTYHKVSDYDESLLGSVQEVGRDLIQMMVLRTRTMDWKKTRGDGMRVATDAHRSVSSFMIESMASRLDYVKNELDEKFEARKRMSSNNVTTTATATIDNVQT